LLSSVVIRLVAGKCGSPGVTGYERLSLFPVVEFFICSTLVVAPEKSIRGAEGAERIDGAIIRSEELKVLRGEKSSRLSDRHLKDNFLTNDHDLEQKYLTVDPT